MQEQPSQTTTTSPDENQMLCRVYFDGPGMLDGMGTGSLLLTPGHDGIVGTKDDELFIVTAGHVAGNRLEGTDKGHIEMFMDGEWKKVENYNEGDVFLKSDWTKVRVPEDDIALIKIDNIVEKYGLDPKNFVEIPEHPINRPSSITAYGASTSRSEPIKSIITDFTVSNPSIITDEEVGIPGDSGGPLIVNSDHKNVLVGITSQSTYEPNRIIERIIQTEGRIIPETTKYVNLDQDDIDFINDVTKNGEHSKHLNISDIKTTVIESESQLFENLALVGAGSLGVLVLAGYGAFDLINKGINKLKKKTESIDVTSSMSRSG